MAVNTEAFTGIIEELDSEKVSLVAVSKTKPVEQIRALYDLGQRDFGENYVQELTEKYEELPKDINWHFIGHLQSNKVKYIAPFIHLIQSVDSIKLMKEINKEGDKNDRVIDILLQVHIATEETKFGLNDEELRELLDDNYINKADYKNVLIRGLMGMASFTDDMEKVRNEFRKLKTLFDKYSTITTGNLQFSILSMGMSADYKVAVDEGSNMVRIGSLVFGERLHPSSEEES